MLLRFTMQCSASKNLIYYIIVSNRSIYFYLSRTHKIPRLRHTIRRCSHKKETLRKVTGFPEGIFYRIRGENEKLLLIVGEKI